MIIAHSPVPSGFAAVISAGSKGNCSSPIITSSILKVTAYILTMCKVKIKAIFLEGGGLPHVFMVLHTRYYRVLYNWAQAEDMGVAGKRF